MARAGDSQSIPRSHNVDRGRDRGRDQGRKERNKTYGKIRHSHSGKRSPEGRITDLAWAAVLGWRVRFADGRRAGRKEAMGDGRVGS